MLNLVLEMLENIVYWVYPVLSLTVLALSYSSFWSKRPSSPLFVLVVPPALTILLLVAGYLIYFEK